MSIIEGSAFIDLAHLSERSASRQLSQSDAPLTGTVSAVVDAERGLVEVQVDGSDDLPVVAVADAGLTYVGARVSLPRDSSGRVVGVKAPSGTVPAGVEVVPVGEGEKTSPPGLFHVLPKISMGHNPLTPNNLSLPSPPLPALS